MHTLTCGCGFRGGGAVPRGAVLGAGAGAVKKTLEGAGAGAGAVQKAEKGAGAGAGAVAATVQNQQLGAGAGAVSSHQARYLSMWMGLR